jgi:peptide/nickel transport system permease protein
MLLTGLLGLSALLAGFIAPYDYRSQDRQAIKAPPSRLHFRDAEGRFHLRPFIHPRRLIDRATGQYEEDFSRSYPLSFFVRGEETRLVFGLKTSMHLFGINADGVEPELNSSTLRPPKFYLLGADQLGRDIFSRLVYGSRASLTIAFLSLFGAVFIGLLIGCLAGYYGGPVDALLMRFTELVDSVPVIFLVLMLRSALPLDLPAEKSLLVLTAIFISVSWTGVARLTRGAVLSLKTREFVLGAIAAGAGHLRVLRQHILPSALTPAIIQATLIVPAFILGEAALSFLGVGIQEPEPSWGNMLAATQDLTVLTSSPWMLSPGGAIFLTALLLNVLGDSIRVALNPQQRSLGQGWG